MDAMIDQEGGKGQIEVKFLLFELEPKYFVSSLL
jgi:hypothetical protein